MLESLLSLPQPQCQLGTSDGTCDENSIVLHGVIQREFDYLLTFLSGGYVPVLLFLCMRWKDEWWNGVARQLLHPEEPCRGQELLGLLDAAEIPGLCAGCKEATMPKITQSDALRQEETLGNIAILDIMELQTDEPIRASFRNLRTH